MKYDFDVMATKFSRLGMSYFCGPRKDAPEMTGLSMLCGARRHLLEKLERMNGR